MTASKGRKEMEQGAGMKLGEEKVGQDKMDRHFIFISHFKPCSIQVLIGFQQQ